MKQEIETECMETLEQDIFDLITEEDLTTDLNQDDCLIFYTDGITEAFSPDGEMFGDDRLRGIVLSSECTTAHQQLHLIDQAVQDFIGDLPYSDDITILTVRRSGK